MIRQRVRIRFCKQDDLRLIGHRDLARTFERLFRRMSLRLSMTEGFHPKPRMTFPSALSLGIAAADEVMELELAEHIEPDELQRRFDEHAPPGLAIRCVRLLSPSEQKARVERVWYEIPLPAARQAAAGAAIDQLLACSERLVERKNKSPVNVRDGLESLEAADGVLRMGLLADSPVGSRPREVLAALGLGDLESQGFYLTRTQVELTQESRSALQTG